MFYLVRIFGAIVGCVAVGFGFGGGLNFTNVGPPIGSACQKLGSAMRRTGLVAFRFIVSIAAGEAEMSSWEGPSVDPSLCPA
jgi:hypothetical protein